MDLNNRLTGYKRLEIELLCAYKALCESNTALATMMLDCEFDMVHFIESIDAEMVKIKLQRIFDYNREPLFEISKPFVFNATDTSLLSNTDTNPELSKIKTLERKIIVTLREIAAVDIDVACGVCGLSLKDALCLANSNIDVVEDWVYSHKSSPVLGLRIRKKSTFENLLEMTRVSLAGIYLDRISI